jgi:hypothetical protein
MTANEAYLFLIALAFDVLLAFFGRLLVLNLLVLVVHVDILICCFTLPLLFAGLGCFCCFSLLA